MIKLYGIAEVHPTGLIGAVEEYMGGLSNTEDIKELLDSGQNVAALEKMADTADFVRNEKWGPIKRIKN